jgi:hypothetical protein
VQGYTKAKAWSIKKSYDEEYCWWCDVNDVADLERLFEKAAKENVRGVVLVGKHTSSILVSLIKYQKQIERSLAKLELGFYTHSSPEQKFSHTRKKSDKKIHKKKSQVFLEAMFMESVMGEGNPGVAITPEFYSAARRLTLKNDGMLLVDNIQAG